MGGAFSCINNSKIYVASSTGIIDKEDNNASEWKLLLSPVEAKLKYFKDKSTSVNCSDEMLECRYLLDDPIARNSFSNFEHFTYGNKTWMNLWNVFVKFKTMPAFRREYIQSLIERMLEKIPSSHHLYIKIETEKNKMEQIVSIGSERINEYVLDIFQNLQKYCVEIIFEEIFIPFRISDQYETLCNSLLGHYNSISMDDFDFFNVIGEGIVLYYMF